MTHKNFRFIILVMTLAFTVAFIACDNGTSGGRPSALIGTWVSSTGQEIQFTNRNFEIFESATAVLRGTYTTRRDIITMQITQVHSSLLDELYQYDEFGEFGDFEIPRGWYGKSQILDIIEYELMEADIPGEYISEILAVIEEALDEVFSRQTGTYEINGDILTITTEITYEGETLPFTESFTRVP